MTPFREIEREQESREGKRAEMTLQRGGLPCGTPPSPNGINRLQKNVNSISTIGSWN
jgi:hypothetical protein